MRKLLVTSALAVASVAALGVAPKRAEAAIQMGPAVAPRGAGRVSIMWESDAPAAQSITLRAPGRADRVVRAVQTGEGVQRADVEGLEPGIEYQYAVDDRAGRFTAPPDASQDVRFAVFGDSRSNDDVHRQVVSQVTRERPDFALLTGDVVPSGASMGEWRNFFEIERPLLAQTPISTARGNHDGGPRLFAQLLSHRSADAQGSAPTYGSMNLGPVHVLMVDTETGASNGSAQLAFIERDLAANAEKPVVVVMHRPLFSSGWHGSSATLQRSLAPLFQRYGVDVVFQGHDHHYERTQPINGVTYVVTGGAGAMLRGTQPNAWTRVAETTHHYVMVEASAARIRVVAKRTDGTQLDAFEIDPSANNGRFAATTSLPRSVHGGGCALLLGGRGRTERAANAVGTMGPIVGLALVGGVRRARRKKGA